MFEASWSGNPPKKPALCHSADGWWLLPDPPLRWCNCQCLCLCLCPCLSRCPLCALCECISRSVYCVLATQQTNKSMTARLYCFGHKNIAFILLNSSASSPAYAYGDAVDRAVLIYNTKTKIIIPIGNASRSCSSRRREGARQPHSVASIY